jgi:hypothetical protein
MNKNMIKSNDRCEKYQAGDDQLNNQKQDVPTAWRRLVFAFGRQLSWTMDSGANEPARYITVGDVARPENLRFSIVPIDKNIPVARRLRHGKFNRMRLAFICEPKTRSGLSRRGWARKFPPPDSSKPGRCLRPEAYQARYAPQDWLGMRRI